MLLCDHEYRHWVYVFNISLQCDPGMLYVRTYTCVHMYIYTVHVYTRTTEHWRWLYVPSQSEPVSDKSRTDNNICMHAILCMYTNTLMTIYACICISIVFTIGTYYIAIQRTYVQVYACVYVLIYPRITKLHVHRQNKVILALIHG